MVSPPDTVSNNQITVAELDTVSPCVSYIFSLLIVHVKERSY